MAQLTKAVLGRVSGRLGDMVFRQRNGKNILGRRPSHYAPPDDQGSVDRRARFKFSSKLAQAVYSIPEVAALWEPQTPADMSTFNYIIQKNILVVNPTSVSDLTTIVPDHSFGVSCTGATLTGNAIAVAMAAIGSAVGIDLTKEPNAKMAYVLTLTNPSNSTFPEFLFVSGTSDTKLIDLNSALTFNIALSSQDASSIGSYSGRSILLALLTTDASGNPVKYSGTVISTLTLTD